MAFSLVFRVYICACVLFVPATDPVLNMCVFMCVWVCVCVQVVRALKGHTNLVLALALCPSGRFLYSGSADNTIKAWAVDSGQVPSGCAPCTSCSCSASSSCLLAACVCVGVLPMLSRWWMDDVCVVERTIACPSLSSHSNCFQSTLTTAMSERWLRVPVGGSSTLAALTTPSNAGLQAAGRCARVGGAVADV